MNLLQYKKNVYSQNGEDGIIRVIFDTIGHGSKQCCEFGAWDGIHLSNCRQLIENGWSAVMIEGDTQRFSKLTDTYRDASEVFCFNRYVDAKANNVGAIIRSAGFSDLDFLSIDIDGLDYEIFSSLDIRPRVICVEVNAGHSPTATDLLPSTIAQNNIGQPLSCFVTTAEVMGYRLVCYTGNALFVRDDQLSQAPWPTISSTEAYQLFLMELSAAEREWLYLVNLGRVDPFYHFHNPYLVRKSLGIAAGRAMQLRAGKSVQTLRNRTNSFIRAICARIPLAQL